MSFIRKQVAAFQPRARLVSILGEHLISDHVVGLLELVKNGYDADASHVRVELQGLDLHPRIGRSSIHTGTESEYWLPAQSE